MHSTGATVGIRVRGILEDRESISLGGKKRDPAYATGNADPEYNHRFEVNPKFYGRVRPQGKSAKYLTYSMPIFDDFFDMK